MTYLVKGAVRGYNSLGDYSYGIYIYAFPIQQILALFNSELSAWEMTAYSLPITTILAVTSWHLIEKPFLEFKRA